MSKYLTFFKLEVQHWAEFKLEVLLFWVESAIKTIMIYAYWHTMWDHQWTSQVISEQRGALDKEFFLALIVVTNILFLPLRNPDTVVARYEGPVISGTMASILCRPIHPIWMNLSRILSMQVRMGLVSIVLLTILAILPLEGLSLKSLTIPMDRIPLFAISLLMGYMIHYYVFTCVGLVSFWVGDVWSILYISVIVSGFSSGVYFPLELNSWSDQLSTYLPFRYMSYSPASIWMGSGNASQILVRQLFVVILLGSLAHFMYGRALKKFESSGG